MTFAELVQEVYNLTNRPDLETETKAAVRAATLKAHNSDFYSRDIYETGIVFESSSYLQSLDLYSVVSNFRAIKYIKRVQDSSDTVGSFINIITPDELLDSYGCSKVDIAYVAGRVLEIKSAVSFDKCLLGAYVYPIIQETSYSSWIADLHPYAIVYEAARTIYKLIGYDEQASATNQLVAEEYAMLKMTGLTDVGY